MGRPGQLMERSRFKAIRRYGAWYKGPTLKDLDALFERLTHEAHGVTVDSKGRRVFPPTPATEQRSRFPRSREKGAREITSEYQSFRFPIFDVVIGGFAPRTFMMLGSEDVAGPDSDSRLRASI